MSKTLNPESLPPRPNFRDTPRVQPPERTVVPECTRTSIDNLRAAPKPSGKS